MKVANSIRLSVFVKEGEDEEKVRNKLIELIGLDIEKEKIEIKQNSAEGFDEKKIVIYEVLLQKERHINAFLEILKLQMSDEVREKILEQTESRLDNDSNFFLRFNKEKLLNGELFLTDQGNCFHIKIDIAAFPKKREIALEIISKFFKE